MGEYIAIILFILVVGAVMGYFIGKGSFTTVGAIVSLFALTICVIMLVYASYMELYATIYEIYNARLDAVCGQFLGVLIGYLVGKRNRKGKENEEKALTDNLSDVEVDNNLQSDDKVSSVSEEVTNKAIDLTKGNENNTGPDKNSMEETKEMPNKGKHLALVIVGFFLGVIWGALAMIPYTQMAKAIDNNNAKEAWENANSIKTYLTIGLVVNAVLIVIKLIID